MNKQVWDLPPVRALPEELLRAGYTPLLAAVSSADIISLPTTR